MNYVFTYPDEVFQLAPSHTVQLLKETEDYLEAFDVFLPLVVSFLYEKIDTIVLNGHFSHQKNLFENYHADPLNIDPAVHFLGNIKKFVHDNSQVEAFQVTPFCPDYLTKDGIRGDSYYLEIPKQRKIDARLYTRLAGAWKQPFTLIDYFRLSFQWGGFGGLSFSEAAEQDSTMIKLITYLNHDLKAI